MIDLAKEIADKSKTEPKSAYPSLKGYPEIEQLLASEIAELRKKAERQTDIDKTKTLQTRKVARDNFTYALLLGVAEAKAKGKEIQKCGDLAVESVWDKAVGVCQEISQHIESGMWVAHDSQLSKEYTRKYR